MSDADWDLVNAQIERSKIKRIKWKEILGMSLTKAILLLKKDGLNSNECFLMLKEQSKLTEYLEHHFSAREKIIENLRISVSARYGEAKTESKILRGE